MAQPYKKYVSNIIYSMLRKFVSKNEFDIKMFYPRSFVALRLFSNINAQRTVQFCGFKSRYNIENLYPNTGSDLSVKVNCPHFA